MKRLLFAVALAASLATIGLRAQSAAAAGSPVVNPGGPYAGLAGAPIQFSGVAVSDSGTEISYIWTFGDGDSAGGAAVIKIFMAPGTYNVALTATDGFGLTITAYTTATVGSTVVTPQPSGASTPNQLIDPATIGLCGNGIAIINGLVFDCNTGRLIGTIQINPALYCNGGPVVYLNDVPYACATTTGGAITIASGAAPVLPQPAPTTP